MPVNYGRMLKIVKRTSFLVFLGILLVIFLPSFAKIQELRQKNKELEINIKKLEAENLALNQEKEKLEKDPEYLEQVAREKLGIVKKGEIVYKIVPEEE
jgi:cell division protein FtsB